MNNPAAHRKRVKTYNLPGHAHFLTFSCYRRMPLLTNETWRVWLADAVRATCDAHQIALWAYVFMPEHVHLLLKPRLERYDISKYRQALKQGLSQRVIHALKAARSPLLERLKVQERPGKWCCRFWQEGPGHDKNIWSIDKAVEKARYCHRNPVARELVNDPERWHWSSFRWLEQGRRDGEPLRLDPWDERLSGESAPALAANDRGQWHHR